MKQNDLLFDVVGVAAALLKSRNYFLFLNFFGLTEKNLKV